MNETLKEIAVKAQVEHCISHVRLEVFAKLIVDKVLAIINDPKTYNAYVYTTFDSGQADSVAHQIAKKIKEEFKDSL